MTLGYRAILRLENSDDANRIAAEQVRSWLKSKHRKHHRHGTLDAYEWDGPGTHVVGPGSKLTVVSHDGEDGGKRQLLRLDEKNTSGTWRVSVTSTSLPQGSGPQQLIVVEVDADVEATNGRPVSENTNPPNIIRSLLNVTPARDFHSDIQLSASPRLVDVDDVDGILDALLDERRSTSIVLAGPLPGAPAITWTTIIESLVKNSAGTTATFMLTESAQKSLNIKLTSTHALENGAVRTFLPGVRPSNKADALRHRILYPSTLADSLTTGMRVRPSLARVHAATARRQLIDRPLPHEALESARILEREEIRFHQAPGLLRGRKDPAGHPAVRPTDPFPVAKPPIAPVKVPNAVIEPTDPVRTDVSRSDVQVAVGRLLAAHSGSSELTLENVLAVGRRLEGALESERTYSQKIDALLDAMNKVRDDLAATNRQREDLEFELALEAEERRQEAEQRRHFERKSDFQAMKLNALKDFEVFVDPDYGIDDSPVSIIDLLDRLESEPRVSQFIEFTGDADKAFDLDIRDSLGRYASTFWEYVLVMRDYCVEKTTGGFSGNLFSYLSSDHTSGRKCDPKRFAQTESESVKSNTKWRNERTFPVPYSTHSSGNAVMFAHFKTTAHDGVAPRMHIHDDTLGTGKIYIGYLGRHLSNTMTN